MPDGAITLIETVAEAESFTPHDPAKLAYVTQTTLSVDDTSRHRRHAEAALPGRSAGRYKEDICYATTNRQEAVKSIARADRSAARGRRAQLVQLKAPGRGRPQERLSRAPNSCSAPAISTGRTLDESEAVGLTAGASAPEVLVNEIIDAFRAHYDVTVEKVVLREENVSFKLPRELREAKPAA